MDDQLRNTSTSSPAFAELVASRKAWLADVLQPWCRRASRGDLRRAELEWVDLAGKAPPEKTLWVWAWSRFPEAVHEHLGLDETVEVVVTLSGGETVQGFPDSRRSQAGQLVLLTRQPSDGRLASMGPFDIDRIVSMTRVTTSESGVLVE